MRKGDVAVKNANTVLKFCPTFPIFKFLLYLRSDKLRMVFLQLPEFSKEAEDCETYFERWIYLLKNMNILERMPWAAQYAARALISPLYNTLAVSSLQRLSNFL